MALLARNRQYHWHPCSQMKDYEALPPLQITSARGSYLYTRDGRKIIDAIASWWCKSLGHNHPALKQALLEQAERFEHVMFANTTHDNIVALSEMLCQRSGLDKVFYAGDGSCAVEVALKMSLHARQIMGQPQRQRFITLQNSYHGETAGAMSVSDADLYTQPYRAMMFDSFVLQNVPYVNSRQDPRWDDASATWPAILAQLEQWQDTATAIIIEPILQGAGGMKIYSQDFLRRLCHWAQQYGIHIIADEIMTGFYRTGQYLACDYAGITPDFLCVSKGLTSGWLPLSAVVTRNSMYELFYDDYAAGKNFLHSHTFTGNPLAVSIALACLQTMEQEQIGQRVQQLETKLQQHICQVAEVTGRLNNIRHIGGMVAADLITDQSRAGFQVYQRALQLGAFLRPLGNTIYWLPPLNIGWGTLVELEQITIQALQVLKT